MPSTPEFRTGAAPAAKALLLKSGIYSILRRVVPSRDLAILRYPRHLRAQRRPCGTGYLRVPAHFVEHVAYLADNYRVLPLSEAVDALCGGASLPVNAVAIGSRMELA
jgi:hypothetical protein